MLLSIVIINYKTFELTKKCLESIFKEYKKELSDKKIEIVLVDNASGDGSVEKIEKTEFGKKIKIIKSKKNLGFGGGNNLGAEKSLGKYVLFLNSDTEIKDKGFLKMTSFLEENERISILGGKLFFPDGTIQKSVGKFYTLKNLFLMLFTGEKIGNLRESPKKITRADWVSGACMMVRKDVFIEIGKFDEKMFMYMEDVEICYRNKKAGYLTYFYPSITLLHNELGSSNRSFAISNIYKGVVYFYEKHRGALELNIAKFLLYLKAIFAIFIGLVTYNKTLVVTYKSAIKFR